eukprot:GHVS01066582.1.p1 GENE.GHVS01066582.1~~GHVS01066582.1.p1  ORF type:complete len:395 (-),score=22.07 GHVS01066582.1:2263-3447(-)
MGQQAITLNRTFLGVTEMHNFCMNYTKNLQRQKEIHRDRQRIVNENRERHNRATDDYHREPPREGTPTRRYARGNVAAVGENRRDEEAPPGSGWRGPSPMEGRGREMRDGRNPRSSDRSTHLAEYCMVCGKAGHYSVKCWMAKKTGCIVCGGTCRKSAQCPHRYWGLHSKRRPRRVEDTREPPKATIATAETQGRQTDAFQRHHVQFNMDYDTDPNSDEEYERQIAHCCVALTTNHRGRRESSPRVPMEGGNRMVRTRTPRSVNRDPTKLFTLTMKIKGIMVEALLDQGASDCFINGAVVRRLGIGTHKLKHPTSLTKVTCDEPEQQTTIETCTPWMRFSCQGHNDKLRALIVEDLSFDLVVGLSYLASRNITLHPQSASAFIKEEEAVRKRSS